jgi:hypothetical protein
MKVCDICNKPLDHMAVDARTTMGPWAWMCPTCYVKCIRYAQHINGDHRVNQNPAITNQPSEADLFEALEHNEAERIYFEQIQNPQIYDAWIQTLKEKIRKATEQIGELERKRFVAPGRVTACLSRAIRLQQQLTQVRSDRSKAAAEKRSDRQGEQRQTERLTAAQKLELWERAMTWMVTVQPPERRHCLIDEWNQITDKAEKERWLVEQYQDAMQSGGVK